MTTELSADEWHARAKSLRHATGHFIDGEHVDALAKGRFTVTNPTTLQPLCEVAAGSAADIDRAVASGRRAFASAAWRHMQPRERPLGCRRLDHCPDRRDIGLKLPSSTWR